MYPLQCEGGYAFPIKKGMRTIVSVMAAVNDTSSAARLALIDSDADAIVTDGQTVKPYFIDLKAVAGQTGMLEGKLPEPIKVRSGVALSSVSDNLCAGKIFVYVK